jgi:glycosyltransferase involved in cell wall biosynthesis
MEAMGPRPLLSVVVANYNQERYLDECLRSILRQTLNDLEIVIYDDGSSDRSLEIIRAFAQRAPGRIRLIHDPVNRGVAYARHQAILAARGEYVTTLDSDDYYSQPQKLERELALIREVQAGEGKGIISFSNVVLIKEHAPSCIWAAPGDIRQGLIGPDILGRTCFIPRDFLMRRDWYHEAGGYDLGFKLYEDWDLKIRLAFRHEFRYTGAVGTAYRRHGRGLSSQPASEHRRYVRLVFAKNVHWLSFFQRRRAGKALAKFMDSL